MTDYSEDYLVEQPAIRLFAELGWKTYNGFHEFETRGGSPLGREHKGEVVLTQRLRPALERLNEDLPPDAVSQAVEELTRDRGATSLVEANRQVYRLLKDGVKVTLPGRDDGPVVETVRIVDWNRPERNDFLLVSQLWVSGDVYSRRADLVGFVNGLPLLFLELKTVHRNLKTAYARNLTDYRQTIPHLFWYNGLVVLSNGSESVVGSVTAAWEHFADWKKVASEEEQGIVSLETTIRATCAPRRLLDLVENFCLFSEAQGGYVKILAKNHQYLGVNNALRALRRLKENQGRLGVFWHTQGTGKSVSMILFAQKALRKLPGNWSFVVVTDRQELDDQIYKNFAASGAVTEQKAQAASAAHLRQLLGEDHRYVFTLIHKFRTEGGEVHPVLSERSDIVVMVDEAHRTQYDVLALNMRNALPNAAFIAFTGTPLIVGEERTKEVFGEYVSIYDFGQSIADGATVPLYYENRVPQMQLVNEHLNEDIYQVIEDADLDEEQERRLERELAREYHLITREARLDAIAQDLVAHFVGRGFRGKAMVVSIDKATAVRMYDKVQEHWRKYMGDLRTRRDATTSLSERQDLEDSLDYMRDTDMAVVVSQGQNEVEELRRKGVDITPHRKRMVTEDLETKFKDPDDPFRIVFVCAMWMTGFDVPCCSTIYLDKPMRNHTLMQTIARANRVFGEKVNGLIVDYVGIFRNLQHALAIYGSGPGGTLLAGDTPVRPKKDLVEDLREALREVESYCRQKGADLAAIRETVEPFHRIQAIDKAMDALLADDQTTKEYLGHAATVARLFKAILPDPLANELAPHCAAVRVLALKIRSLSDPADISKVMGSIEGVLDRSIAAEGYVIHERGSDDHLIDLSQIDFEALADRFATERKHIEAQKLRGALNQKLAQMVRLNRSRVDFVERFQRMIEEYNAGATTVDLFFEQLLQFARDLSEEEQRHIAEQLSEEELAVFDLLTRPEIRLSASERKDAKQVARDLLETLKGEKLVLDWRKRQQSRAAVRLAIEEMLDRLPAAYDETLFQTTCESVYQHVYDAYYGAGDGVYARLQVA